MTESFSVQEMRTHQGTLSAIDDATHQASSEAQALGIGDWKMYGLFISPLACGILQVGNMAHGHTINELAGATQAVAEGFKTTADLYEAAEKSNVDLAQSIHTQIDSMEKRTR